jgi:hypothetical protein
MRILVTLVGVLCMAKVMHAQGPASTLPASPPNGSAMVMEPSEWAPTPGQMLPPGGTNDQGYSDQGYFDQGYSGLPGENLPTPDLSQAPPIPEAWLAGLWNPQPILEFRGEVMFLSPNMQPSTPIANTYLLNSDRLAYVESPVSIGVKETFVTSGRGTIEYHLNPFHSFDVSGFISDGPDLKNARVGPSDSTFYLSADSGNSLQNGFLYNIPANFPTIADRLNLDWYFEAFGGEANYWRHFISVRGPWSDIAVGMGVRYFGFRDKTNFTVEDEVSNLSGQMNVSSKNDMLGPQFSAKTTIPTVFSKRLRVFAEGKIGFMANKTSSTTFLDATGTSSGTTYDRTNFSPLFEGNFRVEFYVFENLTLFGGCALFYVERLEPSAASWRLSFIREVR